MNKDENLGITSFVEAAKGTLRVKFRKEISSEVRRILGEAKITKCSRMHNLRKESEFLAQRSVAREESHSKDVSVLGGKTQQLSETGK